MNDFVTFINDGVVVCSIQAEFGLRKYQLAIQTNITLLATYITSGSFVVPSGYSSFKIELIGGQGGGYEGYYYDEPYPTTIAGRLGAKATFIVPVADMPAGSTQSFTVGENGENKWIDSLGNIEFISTSGTDTSFKGMFAGGGGSITGATNGITSGTTYTNTTSGQFGYPPSVTVWGIL